MNPNQPQNGSSSNGQEGQENVDSNEAIMLSQPLLDPHQTAEDALPTATNVHPCLWLSRCLGFPSSAPSEATGLWLDNFARGHLLLSTTFLGPALLELAEFAALNHCSSTSNSSSVISVDDGDEGHQSQLPPGCRIHGFRPSSLLANMAVVSGLLGALSMPIVGAIMDHTRHRRQVASATAALVVAISGAMTMVAQDTWFVVAILQVVWTLLYNVHATAAYAYTSELSEKPDEQAQYNSQFSIVQYVSMLLFLITAVGLSSLWTADTDDEGESSTSGNDVLMARISQVVAASVAMICFFIGWALFFDNRPASSQVPRGGSLWTCGFTKVWQTSRQIACHYRALTWAIVAIMFAEAALAALFTIATTYLKEVLRMSANEIAVLFLIVLVTGIPGSYLGGELSVRLASPVRSALICDVVLISTTTAAAFLAAGPEHKHRAYLLSAFWGVGCGWLSPVDTTIFMNLMPSSSSSSLERSTSPHSSLSSRAEYMGIMMLAASVLSWLPPLVFSMLNEAGFSMSYGLMSLNLYFLAAMICLFQVGDLTRARSEVSPSLQASLPTQEEAESFTATTTMTTTPESQEQQSNSENNQAEPP